MIDEEAKEEIIIIKRGGEGEEGHHGGAWKIAFADFMTAMMALFLVLWLINAANEETKKSVASYFNPVKLVDRNRSTKGLQDAKGPQESSESDELKDAEAVKAESKPNPKPTQPSDADLHANPYGVLAEIAARPPGVDNPTAIRQVSPGNTGQASGTAEGETFRDPFDPDFWRSEMQRMASGPDDVGDSPDHAAKTASTGLDGETDHSGEAEAGDAKKPGEAEAGMQAKPGMADEGDKTRPGEAVAGVRMKPGETEDAQGEKVGHATVEADMKPGESDEHGKVKGPAEKRAEDIRQELEEAVSRIAGIDPKLAGSISVVPNEDGILISLTDEWDIPMFNVGSSVPSRDLVLAMEKIASVLVEKAGGLRIYGHTDARPYRSGSYDNWQLSVARAQSAYFMLVRAGIAKARFSEVAGFADSRLRDPDEPESATNRRIEILLEGA